MKQAVSRAAAEVTGYLPLEINGLYASFRLKRRLWGQNNKNVHNFDVITNMILVIERYAVHVEENLQAKLCLYRTPINRIRQFSICYHITNLLLETNKSTASVLLTGSM